MDLSGVWPTGTQLQTAEVVGTAPMLIELLSSPSHTQQEQAALGLGNIAADTTDLRDVVRANGAVLPLSRLLDPAIPTLCGTAMWALTNMSRGKVIIREQC